MNVLPATVEGAVQGYVLLLGALVAYAFIVNRLRKLTQPFRLRFAEEAEALLARKVLTPGEERKIHFMLDTAFSGVLPWLLVFLMPVYICREVVTRRGSAPAMGIQDPNLRSQVFSVYGLWLLANCGMSPVAGILVMAELLIGGIIVMPLKEADAIGKMMDYLVSRRGSANPRIAANG
jgi:hypothetical protein